MKQTVKEHLLPPEAVTQAWATISMASPLKHYVAINPLSAQTHNSTFAQAIEEYCHEKKGIDEKLQMINHLTFSFLQFFFGEQVHPAIGSLKGNNLLSSFMKFMQYHPMLQSQKDNIAEWLEDKTDPSIIIAHCLLANQIQPAKQQEYLSALLKSSSGWSGYIKFLAKTQQGLMDQYLAIRSLLALSIRYTITSSQYDTKTEHSKTVLLLNARAEEQIQQSLNQASTQHLPTVNNPDIQVVFCMDVRSEKIRRALEETNKVQTYGAAGFFNLPVSLCQSEQPQKKENRCPVILEPSLECTQVSKPPSVASRLYHHLKYYLLSANSLVELYGSFCGLKMLVNTKGYKKLPKAPSQVTHQMPILKQTESAAQLLRSIGLTKDFAQSVVLCGHESITTNNIFADSLQCGACGGHSGEINATLMASILNNNAVKKNLALQDIHIPESTAFFAAIHETVTDTITLIDDYNPLHQDKFSESKSLFASISKTLYKKASHQQQVRWSEPQPEAGLVDNAVLMIGAQNLTQDPLLQGRCFMHSYDYELDHDGTILSNILSGPGFVAHWINMQYNIAAVDLQLSQSHLKVEHSPIGVAGVISGNQSDLKTNLPADSLYTTTGAHQIARLHILINAPIEVINKALSMSKQISQLVNNQWLVIMQQHPANRNLTEITLH